MSDYTVSGKSTLDIAPFLRSITKMESALAKAQKTVDKLDRAIDKLGRKSVSVKVSANVQAAEDAILRVERRLAGLNNKSVRVTTTNVTQGSPGTAGSDSTITTHVHEDGADSVIAKMAALQATLDSIDKNIDIRVNEHGALASSKNIDSMGRAAERSNKQFSLMTAAIAIGAPLIGPVLGAALGVAAGAMGALGVAVGGGAAFFLAAKNAAGQLNSVLEAQKNVTKALASGDWTQISQAYNAQTAAMEKLGPVGQRTFALLTQLKSTYKDFGNGIKNDVFETFNNGLTAANTLLIKAEPVAASAAQGLKGVTAVLNERIDTGGFDKFFNYLEHQAGPILTHIGNGLVNFIQAFTNIIPALDPVVQMVTRGFENMSRAALNWSKGLDHNDGFQKFMQYVVQEGPKVWDAIKKIAQVGMDLITALAPLGGATLNNIRVLADAFHLLIDNPIGQFVVQVVALVVALKQLAALTGITGLISGIKGAAAGAGAALGGAEAGALAGGATRAAGAMGFLRSAGAGLVGMLGGPWGIAIGAAVVGVAYFANAMQNASDAQKKRIGVLSEDITKTQIAGMTSKEAADKVIGYKTHMNDLSIQIAKASGANKDYATAMLTSGGHTKYTAEQIAVMNEAAHAQGVSLAQLKGEWNAAKENSDKFLGSLGPLERKQLDVAVAQENVNNALKAGDMPRAKAAAEDLAAANAVLSSSQYAVNQQYMTQGDLMVQASANAYGAAAAAVALSNAQLQADDALSKWKDTVNSGSASTAALTAAGNNLTTTFANSASAAGAQAASLAQAAGATDTSHISTLMANTALLQMADSAGVKLPATLQTLVNSLKTSQGNTGLLMGAVQDLGASVVQVPGEKYVKITSSTPEQLALMQALGLTVTTLPDGSIIVTTNAKDAAAAIDAAAAKYRTATIWVKENFAALNQYGPSFGGGVERRARGGLLVGPGTGTSDSIPALNPRGGMLRVSDGEFIVRAQAVDKVGMGFMNMLNSGMLPEPPSFPNDGPVTIPSTTAIRGSDGPTADNSLRPRTGGGHNGPLVSIGSVVMQSGQGPADLGRDLAWTLTHGLPSIGMESA